MPNALYVSENFQIYGIRCEQFGTNSYILLGADKSCVLIDCIIDEVKVLNFLEKLNCRVEKVICTHGHFDHIGCAHQVQKKYNSTVYINPNDIELAKKSNFLLMACGSKSRIKMPAFTKLVEGCLKVTDSVHLNIWNCSGHTNGSILVFVEKICFTGDSVFGGSFTSSKLPGECLNTLRYSLKQAMSSILVCEKVFPGHGRMFSGKDLPNNNLDLMKFVNDIHTQKNLNEN